MTQREANDFMLEQFEYCAQKARTAETEEERDHFTDAAHKLYITLTQVGAFDSAPFPASNSGNIQ